MILVPKDCIEWLQEVRMNHATGFRTPMDRPISELVHHGKNLQLAQTGTMPTHILFGHGVRHRINMVELPYRDTQDLDGMYMGMKIRWVEGSGIELLTDIYKEA